MEKATLDLQSPNRQQAPCFEKLREDIVALKQVSEYLKSRTSAERDP